MSTYKKYMNKNNPVINEKDYYPPEDKRYWRSGVKDISGGDSFWDFFKYFFETYTVFE